MRILLISYHFPPYNTMGAVRASKTAKYLVRAGHSVRVVSARSQGEGELGTLDLEIPGSMVSWTSWIGIRRRPNLSVGGRADSSQETRLTTRSRIYGAAYRAAHWSSRNLIYVPDREIGWFPFAAREAVSVATRNGCDVVYASAPPYTSLVVGAWVARRVRVPLVCELRDLWADPGLRHVPHWARGLDTGLERLVLSSAAGLVAVSGPHAELLGERYQRPAVVVTNGFDPEDYPSPAAAGHLDTLHVAYTGTLYDGFRDPLPLFEAAKVLAAESVRVRVHFYGPDSDLALRRATFAGAEDCVVAHAAVPYKDSLRVQVESDVLLLLDQGERTEAGNLTGKLFEYIGARRPILVVGRPDYAAAQLVIEQGLGCVTRDPSEIVRFLRELYHRKQQDGRIADLGTDTSPYTRAKGVETLVGFLEQVIREAAVRGGSRPLP